MDEVVELDDGAAVELVVAVVVAAPVLLLVSVDALVVVAADVSAVVELLVEDDVVCPQAAIAARAPAAAKLKIKRIAHLSSRKLGRRRHRRPICQTPWRNLTNLKVARNRVVKAGFWLASTLDDIDREPALAGFLVLGRHVQAGLPHGLNDLIERNLARLG